MKGKGCTKPHSLTEKIHYEFIFKIEGKKSWFILGVLGKFYISQHVDITLAFQLSVSIECVAIQQSYLNI